MEQAMNWALLSPPTPATPSFLYGCRGALQTSGSVRMGFGKAAGSDSVNLGQDPRGCISNWPSGVGTRQPFTCVTVTSRCATWVLLCKCAASQVFSFFF